MDRLILCKNMNLYAAKKAAVGRGRIKARTGRFVRRIGLMRVILSSRESRASAPFCGF